MTTADPALPKPPKSGAQRPSVLFYVLLAAALFVFIQTFALLSPIVLSLLLILLISLALNPVIARMRAWTGGRKGAAGLLALAVTVVMALTGWAFTVPMRDSVTQFSEQLPEYWERVQKPLIRLEQQAESSEERLQSEVTTEIAQEKAAASEFDAEPAAVEAASSEPAPESAPEPQPEGSVRSSLGQIIEGAAGSFGAVAVNGAQILIVLLTVFFGVIYTLMNPRPIFGLLFSLVPDRHHDQALTIMQRIGEFVPRWAGATLLGMSTIGILVFSLMWLLFGFMDALVLGLIAGIFAAVPFLGPLLSAVPALLLAFREGGMTPLWVALAYLGIQALENNVVVPFVMARGMQLHPLAVIFSMLLCVAAIRLGGYKITTFRRRFLKPGLFRKAAE